MRAPTFLVGFLSAYIALLDGVVNARTLQAVPPNQDFSNETLQVQSPSSEGWYGPSEIENGISFAKRGTDSDESYIAAVSVFRIPEFSDPEAFADYMKKWLEKDSPANRFETLETTIQYTAERRYPCVRYHGVAKDKKASTSSIFRKTLRLEISALYCQHPYQSNLGFTANYSHRGGDSDEHFTEDAEKFISSIQAAPQMPDTSLGVTSAAPEGDLENGLVAFTKRDYVTALKLWQPLADSGNATAQFNLGKMYDSGKGVPKNSKIAARWYTVAAEQGVAKAQYDLGWMYFNGEGVQRDTKTAVRWYTAAAEQSHAHAQYELGLMYYRGEGVQQDMKAAVRLYTASAMQGYAYAQHNLGLMYAKGEGVQKDIVRAYVWFNIATVNGDTKATPNQDRAAKLLTTAQLEKATAIAKICLESNYQQCE
jgi:uncharacterized protein